METLTIETRGFMMFLRHNCIISKLGTLWNYKGDYYSDQEIFEIYKKVRKKLII